MATSDLPPQTLKVGDYTFTISEANYDDIPDFVDAFSAAFSDNLLFKTMSGTGDPALLRQKDLAYWEGQWNMSGRRHFKVVDEATGYGYYSRSLPGLSLLSWLGVRLPVFDLTFRCPRYETGADL